MGAGSNCTAAHASWQQQPNDRPVHPFVFAASASTLAFPVLQRSPSPTVIHRKAQAIAKPHPSSPRAPSSPASGWRFDLHWLTQTHTAARCRHEPITPEQLSSSQRSLAEESLRTDLLESAHVVSPITAHERVMASIFPCCHERLFHVRRHTRPNTNVGRNVPGGRV